MQTFYNDFLFKKQKPKSDSKKRSYLVNLPEKRCTNKFIFKY